MANIAKIFVGRLAWKTSKDTLTNYFNKFGSVTDARVISDRETGRSKGFGFVTFADQASLDNALKQQTHEIDGRSIIVNLANERPPSERSFNNNNNNNNNKFNDNQFGNDNFNDDQQGNQR